MLAVAGCKPDYSGTTFRCDDEHPECPDGQTCQQGFCSDGFTQDTGSGRRDAGLSPTATVACGDAGMCGVGQTCCYGVVAQRCIPNGEECSDRAFQCDSKADCVANQRCCDDGNVVTCGNSDDCPDEHIYCQTSADCPTGTLPFCCTDPFTVIYKTCSVFQCS